MGPGFHLALNLFNIWRLVATEVAVSEHCEQTGNVTREVSCIKIQDTLLHYGR